MSVIILVLSACSSSTLNNPYPKHESGKKIIYTFFSSQPKHLDPAVSYSSTEYTYIGNIYEPPLQYHYLKRPYELIPLTASKMPVARFLDKNEKVLAAGASHDQIAYTVYRINIKKGIKYQPHPAFAKDKKGQYLYHNLTLKDLVNKNALSDFKKTGTRELTAADYVYQMKRLAHPKLNSPILSTMGKYIVGLKRLSIILDKHIARLDQRLKILVVIEESLAATNDHKSLMTRMLLKRQDRLRVLKGELSTVIAQQKEKLQKSIEHDIGENRLEADIIAKLLHDIELGKNIQQDITKSIQQVKASIRHIDLSEFELSGVKLIDRYTYEIKIKNQYPQILYWLAMPFFSPVPHEAIKFYAQPGMKKSNIVLNWYPVGTGAYMLTKNDPNGRMMLERNPNFRGIPYPSQGMPEDHKRGLLKDAGKIMPFVDAIVFSREKESIPIWNKFLQGFFDLAGINSESFDQAVKINIQGDARLTGSMRKKNIKLLTTVKMTTTYMGFNMLDPVVGGKSERARKLRQAISIIIDYKDYISIFLNGRGQVAQGPIPPGIVGYAKGKEDLNTYIFDWVDGRPKRKSKEYAKKLLAEAGYTNGIDQRTGQQLIIHFEAYGGGAEDKALWRWYTKQLAEINIQLQIRSTDYNRFQDKMRNGKAQMFAWGWNADYPDPENFLFLLYGPNGKVKHKGENAANYNNEKYNRLFRKIETMPNSPARTKLIKQMIKILRHDAPWIWGYHSKSYVLFHDWYLNAKPHAMAHNTLMFKRIRPLRREKHRQLWNKPVFWPFWLMLLLLVLILVPAFYAYRSKVHNVKYQQHDQSGGR